MQKPQQVCSQARAHREQNHQPMNTTSSTTGVINHLLYQKINCIWRSLLDAQMSAITFKSHNPTPLIFGFLPLPFQFLITCLDILLQSSFPVTFQWSQKKYFFQTPAYTIQAFTFLKKAWSSLLREKKEKKTNTYRFRLLSHKKENNLGFEQRFTGNSC